MSLVLTLLILLPPQVASIGCFVCSSFNGSNPSCEDPFNSTTLQATKDSTSFYKTPCWAYKKGREGLFPADHCIKINGVGSHQGMIIRTCALDSGSLTADTEIVRISHCGRFKFEGAHYSGCVQACDSDGCNASRDSSLLFLSLLLPLLLCLLA